MQTHINCVHAPTPVSLERMETSFSQSCLKILMQAITESLREN